MRSVVVLLCLLGASVGVPGRRALEQAAGQHEKTAGQAFKNLQVFKDLPESQLMQAMFFMRGSLGVSCTHCHVDFEHFEKDDKPAKHVARDMIRMVLALNKERFDDRTVISCNTCHRGQTRPSAPLGFAAIVSQPSAPTHADAQPSKAMPTVDQVFDRYIEATGGVVAQQHLSTLVITGSKTTSEGWTAPLEIDEKAPAKALSTFQLKGAWRSCFSGTAGWGQDNQDIHALDGEALALFRLKSSFYRPLTLKAQYGDLAFAGTEAIAGHGAYVIEGTLSGAGRQRLFFDVQSGRLVRITASTETPFGPLPEELDLDDYRSVAGVRLPFAVRDLKPDFSEVDRVAKVRTNVPIDDKRFERPALTTSVAGASASAAQSQPAAPPAQSPALELTRGRTPAEVQSIMERFNKSLGVECSQCHVPDAWRDESKPALGIARNMYRMVEFLNANDLVDVPGISCWTCHAGQARPSRLPPDRLTAAEAQWPASLAGAENLKLTMAVYAASLGVTCEHCHVTTDWKSSAKPAHRMVSRMNAMFTVFPKYMPATARTQCWMCHQGAVKPARTGG